MLSARSPTRLPSAAPREAVAIAPLAGGGLGVRQDRSRLSTRLQRAVTRSGVGECLGHEEGQHPLRRMPALRGGKTEERQLAVKRAVPATARQQRIVSPLV